MKNKNNIYVLDCSVTMTWCFSDENTTILLLDSLASGKARVPSIWPLEVSNVLNIAVRKNRINHTELSQIKEFLKALPISIDESTNARAFGAILDLSQDLKITTYDAAYLELAQRENLPIATLDKELQKAAKKISVEVL